MQIRSSFLCVRRCAPKCIAACFALVLMISLAACGGSASTTNSNANTGPVNLTFWSWVPGLDKPVALFNQTHPNIHVTWENVGSGPIEYNKLFTAIKANNAPDVALVEYQYMPTFEATGGLLDLSSYGTASLKDQFVPWTWNQVTLGNAIYAVPGDTGPMIMSYRADLFQKYHIPVPTTWAQYADAAAKLHAADPNAYITDFPPKQPGQFTAYVWQAGGQMFGINGQSWTVSINSAPAQQVASYWQDLINKKLVKTEPDFTSAWYHDFQTGALATWFSGAWGASILASNAPQTKGNWKVALPPQWQAGQTANGNWGGAGNAVFKSTKYPKEAAEFAAWIYTNAQSVDDLITSASIYPAYLPSLNSPLLNSPVPFYGNQILGPLFKQASTQVSPNFQWGPTMDQVYADIGDQFSNATNGQGTLSDGLNTVQQSTVTFMQKQGFSVST